MKTRRSQKKSNGAGRPHGSTKPVMRKQRAYRMPLDIINFLDSQKEPATQIIVNALREKYNLSDPG